MKNTIRYTINSLLIALLIGFVVTPVTFAAQECDKDGDGYIVIPAATFQLAVPDVPYNENGNYTPDQWQAYYNSFVQGQDKLTEDEKCANLNFKKGAEPSRCDNVLIGATSGVYDASKVTTPVSGSSVNPGAFDVPDDGIDQNCDGKDATLVSTTSASTKQLGGLVGKIMSLLRWLVVVVSVGIMVWGGVLYATAAGDENKVSKARKAIIGAIIGLLVGLLAPTIVNLIAANLT